MPCHRRRSQAWREEMAESLLERLRLRAAASEWVGILQVWHDCGQQQARHELHLGHGSRRSDARPDG